MNHGKVIGTNDPLGVCIMAQVARHHREGTRYPTRRVDDLAAVPKVWMGRTAYDPTTLERLRMTAAARRRPIALPGDYILDGERRLPKETALQYRKYCTYRDLGPDRTIAATARGYGGRNTADWTSLASRMRWHERATIWDATMEHAVAVARQKAVEDEATRYAARRAAYLEEEIAIIETSTKRVKQMLSFPVEAQRIVTEKDAEGREVAVTIIEPGKWTYASLSQFIGELQKLARLHFGLPTSNTAIKGDRGGEREEQQRQSRAPESPEEQEAHAYAALKAECAYFDALEEFKARQQEPERLVANLR